MFALRNRKALEAKGKAGRILKKAGTGFLKAGKKGISILQKQAKLIRDQQLRDDAIERRLSQKKVKKVKTKKKTKTKKVKRGSKVKLSVGNVNSLQELSF